MDAKQACRSRARTSAEDTRNSIFRIRIRRRSAVDLHLSMQLYPIWSSFNGLQVSTGGSSNGGINSDSG